MVQDVQQAGDVTVFSTPTCPWCARAKDLLRNEGVAFQEKDVSADRAAAEDMVRRTRQTGVPVIADGSEAIVGFDMPRLKRMAARHKRPGLGLRVKDALDGPGALVGSVGERTSAAQAGIHPGDVIEEMSGAPVRNAADLEQVARRRVAGQPTSLTVRRGQEKLTLILRG